MRMIEDGPFRDEIRNITSSFDETETNSVTRNMEAEASLAESLADTSKFIDEIEGDDKRFRMIENEIMDLLTRVLNNKDIDGENPVDLILAKIKKEEENRINPGLQFQEPDKKFGSKKEDRNTES